MFTGISPSYMVWQLFLCTALHCKQTLWHFRRNDTDVFHPEISLSAFVHLVKPAIESLLEQIECIGEL